MIRLLPSRNCSTSGFDRFNKHSFPALKNKKGKIPNNSISDGRGEKMNFLNPSNENSDAMFKYESNEMLINVVK